MAAIAAGLKPRISVLSAFCQLFQNSIKTFTVIPSTVRPVENITVALDVEEVIARRALRVCLASVPKTHALVMRSRAYAALVEPDDRVD